MSHERSDSFHLAMERRLALRLDDDRDFGGHAREDLDRDLVGAEGLERLLEIDLVAIDVDATAGQRVTDVLRRERAVELAALADRAAQRAGRARDAGPGALGLFALALPLVLAAGDVVLPGPIRPARRRHRELLGDEEVRRVAVGDRLHLPAL